LGHANLRTTERYLSLSDSTLADATTTLAGVIRQAAAETATPPAVVAAAEPMAA